MDTLYVAFRHREAGSWIDNAISYFDPGPFVHAELVLNANLSFAAHAWRGCRFIEFPVYGPAIATGQPTFKTDADWWDFLPVQCNAHDARLVAQAMDGDSYSYLGCMAFVFPFVHPKSGTWFCSELCCQIIELAGGPKFHRVQKIGPNDLYKRLRSLCPSDLSQPASS